MIDFRSDTVTLQTEEMKKAMYNAVVGDDVYDDDPTVKRLEEMAAKMLGKEAGLFVPSGTFGNQLCLLTHTKRGDEVIVGTDSHILYHEVAAAAVIAGVQLRTLDSFGGRFEIDKLKSLVRGIDIHYPDTGLICVENAHGNGTVIGIDKMKEIYEYANSLDIPVHIDGARLFNAAAHLNVDAKEIAQYSDSLTFCLSKGLCAPVGSLVLGTKEFIATAKRNRKLMGGGLRQVGFLAAAGIVSLEKMIPRLKIDHENADYLANKLNEIDGIEVIEDRRDINMVFFLMPESVISEDTFITRLFDKGIKMNGTEDGEYRVVTNNDINKEEIDYLIKTIKEIL